MLKIIYSLLFILLSLSSSFAQTDTTFWFAAPAISPDAWWKDDIKLQISTVSGSATVRIHQPGIAGNSKYDTTLVIGANSTFNYDLWQHKFASPLSLGFDSLEVRPINTVVPYGLKISSSSKIRVIYAMLSRSPNFFNPESFSLKGSNALGTHFLCPFSNQGYNQFLPSDLNGDGILTPTRQKIAIVASKANTTVWITPPCAINGYSANTTHSVLLINAGDCYAIENVSASTATIGNNLSGCEITSNKPIAVTLADDAFRGLNSGCFDLVGNQLVPVQKTGSKYILVKTSTFTNTPAGAYILATQNNTQISFNNGISTTTASLNKGSMFYYNLTTPSASVTCSAPSYCWFLAGVGCEMSAELLTPANCSGINSHSFSRYSLQGMEIDIICPNTIQSTFTLTDAANTPISISSLSFVPVAGSNTLITPYSVVAKIIAGTVTPLPIGNYRLSNAAGSFVIRVTEGGTGTGSSYYESASFTGNVEISLASTPTAACKGGANTLTLSGFISGNTPNGIWTTANGTGTFAPYISNTNLVNTTYSLSSADLFLNSLTFYLTNTGNCLTTKDSVLVQLNNPASISTSFSYLFCTGANSATFQANSNPPSSIVWSGGTGLYSSPTGSSVVYTLGSGEYTLTPQFTLTTTQPVPGCGTSSMVVGSSIGTPFQVAAVAYPSTICIGQSAMLSGYPGTSGPGQVTNQQWISTPFTSSLGSVSPSVTTSYTYSAQYVIGCCVSSTVVTVTVDLCTNVNEVESLPNTVIYPNPSNDFFNHTLPTGTYSIFDGTGRIISNGVSDGNGGKIDLLKEKPGLYFLKYTADKGSSIVLKLNKKE